ncbi:MAG: type II toxin-antitoxin system HicB family antitoxin [Campylobacterota bacterium]|nr:type II toxin-antitoxin system HicB family antitoxin [Campylobacterota bacterium]
MEYIAFIHKEENEYIGVVPDLNYVSSYADTFRDVVHNIIEACELYCEDLKTLPKSSSLEDLLKNASIEKNATPQLIDIKVEKLKRINVMMRSDIINILPQRLVDFNGNRSAYLQNLVLQDLRSHNITTTE